MTINSSEGSICVCKKIFKQDAPGSRPGRMAASLFCKIKITVLLEVCSRRTAASIIVCHGDKNQTLREAALRMRIMLSIPVAPRFLIVLLQG